MSAFGPPTIGAIAAWRIDLGVSPPASGAAGAVGAISDTAKLGSDVISFASSEYRGRVDATLASGLDPGRYAVTIEGITEDLFRDTKKLAGKQAMLCAKLYLFWQDSSGALDPPVVAVLRITALRRRPGTWRYELRVEGREWVYDLLGQAAPPDTGTSALDRAQAIAGACNVVYTPARAAAQSTNAIEQRDANRFESSRDALLRLEDQMSLDAAASGKHRGGLGMYVIRDGALKIGPDRLDDAVRPDNVKRLDAASGLLMVERSGALDAKDASSATETTQTRRDVYTATSRGRPDIKPGDVVMLTSPELDASEGDFDVLLGPTNSLAPTSQTPTVTAYVQEVAHRQSREQGFVSVVHCIAAATDTGMSDVEQLWFPRVDNDTAAAGGSAEARIARQLRKRPERLGTEIAQVRQLFASGDQLPVQTEKLARGATNDGKPHGAIRLALGKGDSVQGVPYTSPFAWGPFGLSVPRYPGMRVLLAHRGGDPDDAVDVGALWDANAAPAAQPGDWWLSLPAAIAQDRRAKVADGDDPPQPTGKASNDLTDADGNRVIGVGKLTVRVGNDALTDAGKRPTPSDPIVSIEHGSSGAQITIDQNGAIVIQAKGKLTLACDKDIVLDAASITMQVSSSVAINKK